MVIKFRRLRWRLKGPVVILVGLLIVYLTGIFHVKDNAKNLSSTELAMSIYYKKIQEIRDKGYLRIITDVKTCNEETSPIEPCMDTSCHENFPPFKIRVRKVLSSIRSQDHDMLLAMMEWAEFQAPPTGTRLLFITATSSNHFFETFSLIRHLQETVFPTIENYTMELYDLGLTTQERFEVEQFCECEVRTFPIKKMPEQLKSLTCYAWKPLIIKANLHRADILVYMDSSTRFGNGSLQAVLDDVQVQGLACVGGGNSMPQNIDFRMMEYFNTTPCLYSAYGMRQAGFLVLHNHEFIRELIIKPWAVCAVSPDCMCPVGSKITCDLTVRKYGKCHRYDQAAFSLILVNLFGRYVASSSVRNLEVEFRRIEQHYKRII